jgi:hypothetical protein
MNTGILTGADELGEALRAILPGDDALLRYLDQISSVSSTTAPTEESITEPGQPSGPIVRYMLAFAQPNNIAPKPILHRSVLGRSSSANIHLVHDDYISVRHCRFGITCDSASGDYVLFVEDLGSTNGTMVEGKRLEEHRPMRLKHGNRIQFGHTHCVIVQVPY